MTQLYSNIQGGLEDRTYTAGLLFYVCLMILNSHNALDEVLSLCRQQLKSITVEVVNQAMAEPSEHKPAVRYSFRTLLFCANKLEKRTFNG